MRFIAKKPNKKVIVGTEGKFVILCHEYKNPTQAEIAAKRLKDQYRKQGWDIQVIVKTVKEETTTPVSQKEEKRRRIRRLFGYKTIVEE